MSEQFDPKELENTMKENSKNEILLTPEQRIDLQGLKEDIEKHFPENWKIETEDQNDREENEEKAA